MFESGIDTGGPRKEFSRLLAMEISDGPYFQVGKGGSFFVCNTSAYEVKLLNAFFMSSDYICISTLFTDGTLQNIGLLLFSISNSGRSWLSLLPSTCL